MKKIWKIFAAAFFVLFTSVSFSSCDMLAQFFADMFEDAFEGPSNEWLALDVKYDDGILNGDVTMAFFYTEKEKRGHTTQKQRLKMDYPIKEGLTVICYGGLTVKNTGLNEMAYMKSEISLNDGAKGIWSMLFNLSPQLRDLAEGKDIGQQGNVIGGTSYGQWSSYNPELEEKIRQDQELAPSPITNEFFGKYFTNDDEVNVRYPVDWNKPLSEIGLSTRTVTKR